MCQRNPLNRSPLCVHLHGYRQTWETGNYFGTDFPLKVIQLLGYHGGFIAYIFFTIETPLANKYLFIFCSLYGADVSYCITLLKPIQNTDIYWKVFQMLGRQAKSLQRSSRLVLVGLFRSDGGDVVRQVVQVQAGGGVSKGRQGGALDDIGKDFFSTIRGVA